MANYLDANIFYKALDVHLRGVQVDHGAVVEAVMNGVAGETLALMDGVVLQSDGKWDKCDADVEAEAAGLFGMVLSSNAGSLTVDDVFVVVLRGRVRDDTWTWPTPGLKLYISATSGQIDDTPPAVAGQFSRCVGYVITDDEIYLDPDSTVVEIPA